MAESGILHQCNLSALEGGDLRLTGGEFRVEMDHEFLGAFVVNAPEAGQHRSSSGAGIHLRPRPNSSFVYLHRHFVRGSDFA